MGVLRHDLSDQQVLYHPIIANGLIAPLVAMTCRLLLRRVASRGVLPRERFSPLASSRYFKAMKHFGRFWAEAHVLECARTA